MAESQAYVENCHDKILKAISFFFIFDDNGTL